MRFVFKAKVQGRPVDLIRGFDPALTFLQWLHSRIFRQLLSLEQSTSKLWASARGGSQECISAAEQKLLGNQTSNKFIFKAWDLGNWNYLGGTPFNGIRRISSFLAENIPGCDEELMSVQGSNQISNIITVEKMLSIITFQMWREKKKKHPAKKADYLREILSSSEIWEGIWSHQLAVRSEA